VSSILVLLRFAKTQIAQKVFFFKIKKTKTVFDRKSFKKDVFPNLNCDEDLITI